MSTTPTDPTPAAEATTPAPAAPAPADPAPTPETDWKAEARKWEERAKKNSDAAARLAEIEEASKSEAEKQAEALAAAQAKVKEFETREQINAWKAEVAKATGVPAEVLAGSTKEEIEAHAETLKPLIEGAAAQQVTPDPAVPTVGKTPAAPVNIPLADQIAAAQQTGDTALVAQLKAMQLGAAATT